MKPGWKTSEFWITMVAGIPALLVSLGVIPSSDQGMLDSAVSKVMAGLIAASAIWKYVHSRALVKRDSLLPIVVIVLLGLAPSAQAEPPVVEKTCWFFNQQPKTDPVLLQTLQQLANQQQQLLTLLQQRLTPSTPQIIVLGAPYQQIPLGQAPLQQIPLGPAPQQQIPLGPPPLQQVPLGPPPQQQIPIGPAPRQDIPLGQPPQQPKPQGPGNPSGYQRYSHTYAWRPALVK